MGNPTASGSRLSIFAEAVKNLFLIIIRVYIDSCTPAAPWEWPLNDFVELILGTESAVPKTLFKISCYQR